MNSKSEAKDHEYRNRKAELNCMKRAEEHRDAARYSGDTYDALHHMELAKFYDESAELASEEADRYREIVEEMDD